MLFFHCPPPNADLTRIAADGLLGSGDEPVILHTTLDDARSAAEDGPILVVNGWALPDPPRAANAHRLKVERVPPAALCNADPYHPPRAVTAGGGYIGCRTDGDVALLLIHRRGVWDLPKGKQDPGETVEDCALREVREEIGIRDLRIVRPLGTTQHGYVRAGTYDVKTTHWFLMQTPERQFAPEAEEDIERVAWARWSVARTHIGYELLRRHMDQCEDAVRAALPE
jgi:8-oxo-dGTP pyrophosphatase MutT (NUDIX family)